MGSVVAQEAPEVGEAYAALRASLYAAATRTLHTVAVAAAALTAGSSGTATSAVPRALLGGEGWGAARENEEQCVGGDGHPRPPLQQRGDGTTAPRVSL